MYVFFIFVLIYPFYRIIILYQITGLKSMKEIVSFSELETKKAAYDLVKKIIGKTLKPIVVCLKGDLGAGKTVFVKGFSEYLGINPDIVKSPTYTYMRMYKGKDFIIYHFDYYRLKEPDELVINEILEIIEKKGNILLIEWPEKIEKILPKRRIEVNIEQGETNKSRKIRINHHK